MTVGDRVRTPRGDGTVTEIHTDDNWTYRRPNPAVYVIVHVDGEPYGRILLPEQVQPIQEEQLTMETTETTTTETETVTTTDEPATDTEPETEDETTDDSDEAGDDADAE